MTTSEVVDCSQINELQAQNEEKIILKVQNVKNASDKAVEMDTYLTPHKDVIQSRYISILDHLSKRMFPDMII